MSYQGYFTRQEWFRLPLAQRQRWWRETGYGKIEPSKELYQEMRAILDGGGQR